MENSTGKSNTGDKANVRVVVVGDHGTGKYSLIVTDAAETLPQNVPPVLPPTRLLADFYPDRVPVTIIDTSSSLENRSKLSQELRLADVVVLTYACDQPATLDRLSTFWLPELRRLEVVSDSPPDSCKAAKINLSEHSRIEEESIYIEDMQLQVGHNVTYNLHVYWDKENAYRELALSDIQARIPNLEGMLKKEGRVKRYSKIGAGAVCAVGLAILLYVITGDIEGFIH